MRAGCPCYSVVIVRAIIYRSAIAVSVTDLVILAPSLGGTKGVVFLIPKEDFAEAVTKLCKDKRY